MYIYIAFTFALQYSDTDEAYIYICIVLLRINDY